MTADLYDGAAHANDKPVSFIRPVGAIDAGDIARFSEKLAPTDPVTGCIVWTASKVDGYGRFRLNGRNVMAHRFAWVAKNGEPAQGMVLDHTCRNRACVNPEHLRVVTNGANVRAGKNAKRTNVCDKGHVGALSRTRSDKGSTARACSECIREYGRMSNATLVAAAHAMHLSHDKYVTLYGRSLHTARGFLAGAEVRP